MRKKLFRIEQIYGLVEKGECSLSKARELTGVEFILFANYLSTNFFSNGGFWFKRGTTSETGKNYTSDEAFKEYLSK